MTAIAARPSSRACEAKELHCENDAVAEEALLTGAFECFRAGRHAEAEEAYMQVLARKPDHEICLHYLGVIAYERGDHEAASAWIERALSAKPDYVEAMSNLAVVRRARGDSQGALAAANQAIALAPDLAQAHSNLGNALEDLGELDAALAAYRKAASLNPGFVEAHINCANILRRLGRVPEAIAFCEASIAARPDAAAAHFTLGNIFNESGRARDAAAAFERALALRPDFAEAFINLGNVLQTQEAYGKAADAYRHAISLRPDCADAQGNLGTALENLGELKGAIACYHTAVKLNPERVAVRAWLYHKRREICDWKGIEEEESAILSLLAKDGCEPVHPFAVLSMEASPRLQLCVASAFAQNFKVPEFLHRRQDFAGRKRLKVGYLSSDFCRHATALLMAELFERHDKANFEIIAYSHAPDDCSELKRRLRQAFDGFVDIRAMSDAEAAERIKADGIAVLVELKGYTKGARTGIAARRPAPVQVSFVGFPGTMGADFIDYVIADPIVLPSDQQPSYCEKIVHLPHCYQPNDTKRLITNFTPTRAACGLPEGGFVFCSFNNSYKITPAFFEIWMRLLDSVPESVLWLLDANGLVKDNLRREAAARGVDPDRLVFAPRLPPPEHLARHRLADLFLDTIPYNAHTTASDALWAGLPVLTCSGATFAGRVAASLLHAAGLPELVTNSLAGYEAMGLRLAREPSLLQSLRHKLLGNRHSAPLFDIARFTLTYEAALKQMWETWAYGHEPKGFAVPAVPARQPFEVPKKSIERVAYNACPLCESRDFPAMIGADCSKDPAYHGGLPPVVDWHFCRSCEHVFTSGYFDASARALIFGKARADQTAGYEMERQRSLSSKIIERVARHVPEGRWLDAGSGNGSLLFTAEEWGYVPFGLDRHVENVRALKALGYEAYCQAIEELDHADRYCVISMANVLDHMPFPKLALAAARRLLQQNGALFLSMPNMDSMVWRLLHTNGTNPYWGQLDHYHNFSRRRLYALLRSHGFRPVEYAVSERERVGMEVIAVKEP